MGLAKQNSSRRDLYSGREKASVKGFNLWGAGETQGLVEASVALGGFETNLWFLITVASSSSVIKFCID